MRVLVTGAAGFIGSEVVRQLRARGDEVTALVRPDSPRPRLRDLADLRCVELALEDGRALDRLLAATRPQAVVHLAWYTSPRDYLVSPENLEVPPRDRGARRAGLRGGLPEARRRGNLPGVRRLRTAGRGVGPGRTRAACTPPPSTPRGWWRGRSRHGQGPRSPGLASSTSSGPASTPRVSCPRWRLPPSRRARRA